MTLVILWLIQDLLTVFTGGGMQIPGLFMLGIVYRLLIEDDPDEGLRAIWSAFAGGVLGLAMGRHPRVLHARLRHRRHDSYSGLGSYTSAGQSLWD